MGAPPPLPPPQPNGSRLQHMLQSAVQAVQWTYSLFWQFCPEQGMLLWGEGYYNGAIKTRKTVHPMEVTTEEASLQRSQQLRELYDSLSAGDSNNNSQQQQQPVRRPCAALSPEDLTELEWFYLMCVSFSFPPGVGLPGRAYAKGQHVWLSGATEVDSKVFSRAILAKSACIQTVVCIPLMDGVVELGFTERVQEDPSFIHKVKSFFTDHHHHHHHNNLPPSLPPPKPALSEHSTSNPATASSSDRSHLRPHVAPTTYSAPGPVPAAATNDMADDEEEDDDEGGSDSEAETGRPILDPSPTGPARTEPSELMQLEMSEDIRLGSPEDASNNMDSDFNAASLHRVDSFRAAESTRRWPVMMQQQQQQQQSDSVFMMSNGLQLPAAGNAPPIDDSISQEEDTHYTQTVSIILQFQSSTTTTTTSSSAHLPSSPNTAFSRWTSANQHHLHHHLQPADQGTSQWLLKYILFTVPLLHAKCRALDGSASPKMARFRSGKTGSGAHQDELSANHVLAERRRREKLNERFIILRSLVPFVTKMDKASILGDTIEYVKQLRKKIQDLEGRTKQMEVERTRAAEANATKSSGGSGVIGIDKRKVRMVEGSGGRAKAVDEVVADMLQVSIIESDALVELHCPYKEGLLLDVMLTLKEMKVEVTAVQSSLNDGFFVAEIRAKVKENTNGKKASIVEVKRAINQIVPHTNS